MDIYILEPPEQDGGRFTRAGTISSYKNVEYSDLLDEAGEFTLTIPFGANYARECQKGRFVLMNEWCGRIDGVTYEANKNGDMLTVQGKNLLALLEDRITVPPQFTSYKGAAGYDPIEGDTETCVKHYWSNNLVAPTATGRRVQNLVIAENHHRGITDDKYMSRFDSVAEVTQKLCQGAQMGCKIAFDSIRHCMEMDVFCGVNRTAAQKENSRVIFEMERNNVESMQYSASNRKMRNTFYVTKAGAEFADEAFTMMYYRNEDTAEGLNRREKWMSISAESPTAGDEYYELKRYAQIQMKEYEAEESFIAPINPNSGYGLAWKVGDFVTVVWKEIGAKMDIQITGVTVTHDDSGVSYVAKFGKGEPKFMASGNQIIKL